MQGMDQAQVPGRRSQDARSAPEHQYHERHGNVGQDQRDLVHQGRSGQGPGQLPDPVSQKGAQGHGAGSGGQSHPYGKSKGSEKRGV